MLSDSPRIEGPVSAEPLIRLDEVRKSFTLPDGRTLEAVRPTSLAIARGDIFGIFGKSGAGKSTLLRLINLLERPDAGRVIVGGRELTALAKPELRDARQAIGMIFQQFNLLQNASVFDNVAFPLRIHGRHADAELRARVDECLALVGLVDKAGSHPAQLSGGQKQRVAIARALASRPDVLLCDEPTSALDAETTESLLATLRDINAQLGVTIVIVTHELSVVTALCRNAVVVVDGRIADRFDLESSARFLPVTRLGRDLLRLRGTPEPADRGHELPLKEAARA
ncbi:MAG: ATP-binding cassette domain-containing protein [Betaproteobacteria bacterium]